MARYLKRASEGVGSTGAEVRREDFQTRYAALPVRIHVKEREKEPEVSPRQVSIDMKGGAAAALLKDATLRPGEVWETTYHVTPPERGDFRFGALYLRCRTPLGPLVSRRTSRWWPLWSVGSPRS